ncbi:aspartic peptidase a1 [Moniliophthora roreri MCA 2997]|uniref:Aspartic peptidase a1 n=1 Tax=Moniliophthora roreri (strain MCA 2997) TaxID=1381753 RepID=V2XBE9_MONRO|nr:aspartic peptidase a1 [Moniliophthora roreri MCA 2997]KAI3619852.1 aspartic peptidase a1 [Moniliophthora roreri]
MVLAWKGKGRASDDEIEQWKRDEAEGEANGLGVVLKLDFVGNGVNDQTYTLPIQLGTNQQTVSLQIDTGSSDIWVASTLCSSCGASGNIYNPTVSGTSSNVPFDITYLSGYVQGTIYWDTFNIGGYSIESQALAAATVVNNEPLQSKFNGVLGLALPQNSIISGLIAPSISSPQDGAHFLTNLFSISPQSTAPAARFISLTLSRPGSDRIPSLLGIGRHPSKSAIPAIGGDGQKVQYATPLPSVNDRGISVGTLFWKSSIKDVTVWVDNQPRPVKLARSGLGATGGGSYPTAVLDSGVPLILSTRAIADAIYGAIGISPASDGMYYVDCKTPLNLTITLDDRSPIPLHPLDLTTEPGRSATSLNCVGVIQASDDNLRKANAVDMILGVPFVRNVYMVMAYQVPNTNGSFPDLRTPDNAGPILPSNSEYRPRLGLQALTDPEVAMYEFKRVRVDGLPLVGGPGNGATDTNGEGKKHLSVGLGVLFGLIGFIFLCFGMFGLRWCLAKRKYSKSAGGPDSTSVRDFGAASDAGATALGSGVAASGLFGWWKREKRTKKSYEKGLGDYELAMRKPSDDLPPHEDILRRKKFEEYMRRERMTSDYSMSTARTRVGEVDEADEVWHKGSVGSFEGGGNDALDTRSDRDSAGHESKPWDPETDIWGVKGAESGNDNAEPAHKVSRSTFTAYHSSRHDSEDESRGSPERVPMISRVYDNGASALSSPPPVHTSLRHSRVPSGVPLLPPLELEESPTFQSPVLASPPITLDNDMAEFGVAGMAGVGTAARSSRVDPHFRYSTTGSESSRSSGGSRRKSSTGPVDNALIHTSPDLSTPPLSAVDEFANRNRPISVASTASSRGRPARPPMGPRQSTVSSNR